MSEEEKSTEQVDQSKTQKLRPIANKEDVKEIADGLTECLPKVMDSLEDYVRTPKPYKNYHHIAINILTDQDNFDLAKFKAQLNEIWNGSVSLNLSYFKQSEKFSVPPNPRTMLY